jgi:hypothetical protein
MEALRDIHGDRFPVQKGELRQIRFGYDDASFIPRVVAQARAGETLDWGGASVFTDTYQVVFDGPGPVQESLAARMGRSFPAKYLFKEIKMTEILK